MPLNLHLFFLSKSGMTKFIQEIRVGSMKHFVKILVSLLIVLFISTAAMAQPGRGNRAEMETNRIKEKVGLTDEQTKSVRTILKQRSEAMRKEFEVHEGDRSAIREAMQKNMQKSDSTIEKLLTADQKKKFELYKKERDEEIRNRMKERQR